MRLRLVSSRSDGTRHWVLLAVALLSFATGVTDAFAFSCLGGIFTANMTGNLILLGMFSRSGYLDTLRGASIALLAFLTAAYTGFRLVSPGGGALTTRRLLLPLGSAFCLKLMAAVTWGMAGGASGVRECVIALSACALGLQTALVRRLSVLGGVTTMYVTGTMTTMMESIADGRGASVLEANSVLCLVAGAVAGTACTAWLAWTAPVLAAICIALAAPALVRVTGRNF